MTKVFTRGPIGFRIWLLVILSTIGIALLLITDYVSNQQMGKAQALVDKATQQQALAWELEAVSLQLRRNEKDFLLRRDPRYIDRYNENSEDAQHILQELQKENEDPFAAEAIVTIQDGLKQHRSQLQTVADLVIALGLDHKTGNQGRLREAAHNIEARLEDANPILQRDLLSLRRHEKDFIMRLENTYVDRFQTTAANFRESLASNGLREATYIELLEAYHQNFLAYAEQALLLNDETTRLSKIYADLAPSFDDLRNVEQALLNSAKESLTDIKITSNTVFYTTTILIVTVISLLSWQIIRSILRPLTGIKGTINELSEGNYDVRVPHTELHDELGSIARAMDDLKTSAKEAEILREKNLQQQEEMAKEKEQQLIKEQEEKERQLLKEQEEQEKNQRIRKQELLELAGQFEKTVMAIVHKVLESVNKLEDAANGLTETAENTFQKSASVTKAAKQASTNAQMVASAAEELSASVREISDRTSQSSQSARDAVQKTEGAGAEFRTLATTAQKIGNVVNLINEIAEQTNLLALNATIESARAGEYGKGFAVVASEVKSLAAQTAKATEEIDAQVRGIQDATDAAIHSIESIKGSIDEIDATSASIASAVEEQDASTQEIARNVGEVSNSTDDVTTNIIDVNEGAALTGAAAADVHSTAKLLASQAQELRQGVDTFLSGIRA